MSERQKKEFDIQREASAKIMKILITQNVDQNALEKVLNETAILLKKLTGKSRTFIVSSASPPTKNRQTTSLKPKINFEITERPKYYEYLSSITNQQTTSQSLTIDLVTTRRPNIQKRTTSSSKITIRSKSPELTIQKLNTLEKNVTEPVHSKQ